MNIIGWLKKKTTRHYNLGLKAMSDLGLDIGGDTIFIGDAQYFISYGVIYNVPLMDRIRAFLWKHFKNTLVYRLPK